MRVLHLTPELPYEPGGGGGRTREFYLCRRLVELGHEVLDVSPLTPDELERTAPLEASGVPVWGSRRPASPLEEVGRAVAREPAVLWSAVRDPVRALEMRVMWTTLRPVAQRAVAEFRPDVVLVGHDMALAWTEDLPSELPAVLTCHNLTWHWYESRARLASPPHSWALRAEAERYRRHVTQRLSRYDTAVAVSTIEADELREIDRCRVELIPTGVDVGTFHPTPEQDGPPRVVFTGTMSYAPNDQGARWLMEQVWPHVRREVPDAVLDVVGKGPSDDVVALGERTAGATVHGGVPEMTPFFEAAHVVAVPILTGAGIRVKIVEAMAAGRAIVSTSLGAEGLGLEPGRHLLIEDEPAAFAAALVALLRDPARRAQLAQEGRRRAEEQFDWRGLGDRLTVVLEDAAARGRP